MSSKLKAMTQMPAEDRRKNPQPLTPEQLEWVTEQTKRASEKAAHKAAVVAAKHVQRRALVGFLILLIGIIVAQSIGNRTSSQERQSIVDSGKIVAVESCNRDYEDRVKFRSLLIRLKGAALANYAAGDSDKARRDAAVEFYDTELANYALFDCRRAEAILTSDPEHDRERTTPYWPGNPAAPKEAELPKPKG